MKCTACGAGHLAPAYLDTMLPCHTCNECGGSLLKMIDYLRWKDEQSDEVSKEPMPVEIDASETKRAMMCPKSGGLMTKYRISANTDHRLDFSAAINAVWLDSGEWDLLKANGLALRLNRIFTDHWQHDIHAQESAEVMRELYGRRFGEHYAELQAMRDKLQKMPDKHEAAAYLLADDPYQP